MMDPLRGAGVGVDGAVEAVCLSCFGVEEVSLLRNGTIDVFMAFTIIKSQSDPGYKHTKATFFGTSLVPLRQEQYVLNQGCDGD